MSPSSTSYCSFCKASKADLRCSQCQQSFYCSKRCQKRHWKSSHKKQCQAWMELKHHVLSLPLEEAQQRYWQVLDEINRLEKQSTNESVKSFHQETKDQEESFSQQQNVEPTTGSRPSTKNNAAVDGHRGKAISTEPSSSMSILPSKITREHDKPKDSTKDEDSHSPEEEPQIMRNKKSLFNDNSTRTKENNNEKRFQSIKNHPKIDSNWNYTMEQINNFSSSFQLTLKPIPTATTTTILDEMDIQNVLIQHDLHGNSTLTIREVNFEIKVSCRIQNYNVSKLPDSFSIRFTSSDPLPEFSSLPSSNLDIFSQLQCCGQSLIKITNDNNKEQQQQKSATHHSIRKVLPLPENDWDEVADYLICYSGQPIVDFSSSSAFGNHNDPTIAFEDPSAIVIHKSNMNETSVFGITHSPKPDEQRLPFSSILNRGHQMWQDSSIAKIGGSTKEDEEEDTETLLCCSYCCQVLGMAASTNMYRLYKYKVGISSITTFVAHQLKRYAESKAIFTFILQSQSSSMFLRVISWDTIIWSSSFQQQWCPVVKVLYEQVNNKQHGLFTNNNHHDETNIDPNNPQTWNWGGLDLCCVSVSSMLEVNNNNKNGFSGVATVQLDLLEHEYKDFCESIQSFGCQLFPRQVKEAFIQVKLGTITKHSNVKMAALPLY